MTARHLRAMLRAGGVAVTALAVAVAGPGPALAQHDAAGAERIEPLTVTPARQLFAVTLHPGEQVRATARVHNGSGRDLELALTPVVVSEHGGGDGADALFLSSRRSADCSAELMAEARDGTLAAGAPVPHGIIAAGATIELCVQVEYPAARAGEGEAVSVVDLAFTGIDRGVPGHPERSDLAGTGGSRPALLALLFGAAGLLTAGSASILRRSRPSAPARAC
ncbi:hypothetical protein [Leucobacter chromiireducens]|nr:hypothetical protein [Leucobacter chromiireducens]